MARGIAGAAAPSSDPGSGVTVFRDHFSTRADQYQRYRPDYPPALFNWLAEQVQQRQVAWDVATGNGQAAATLAEHFDSVIATDASRQQIDNAVLNNRVTYRVAPAEASLLPDQSVDLVTVAAAIHWFDFEKFYIEARRVGRPHAVLAVWSYDMVNVSPEIDAVVWKLYRDITGPYWPEGRQFVEQRYRTIPFPFQEITVPEFEIVRTLTIDDFLGYLRTWSSVNRYTQSLGRDPVLEIEEDIRRLWSGDPIARWPIFMRAGLLHSPKTKG